MECGNKVLQMRLRERKRERKRNKQMFRQLKVDTNILLLDRKWDCWIIIIIWNLSKSILPEDPKQSHGQRPMQSANPFSTL